MIDEIQQVSESGSEPITTAEAKTYLEVDFTDDDTLIASLITTAREYIESYCNVSLTAKTIKVIGSGKVEVDLPFYPVDSSSIAVTDENGGTPSFERLGDTKPYVTINGAKNTRYTIQYDTTANSRNVFKEACKLLVKSMYNYGSIEPLDDNDHYWKAIKLIEPFRL